MAHLTISSQHLLSSPSAIRKIPTWMGATTTQEALNVDVSGALSGQLTVATVPVSRGTVVIRYRSNDELIRRQSTLDDGTWSLSGLEVGQAKYFAYSYTEGAYNVARLDNLAPV